MATPTPIQYFSGQGSLSLSRLDANLRHIAELERSFTALGGGTGKVPYHCREGLAFFYPEPPNAAAAAAPPQEFTPPTPQKGTLWAPGLLDSICITEQVEVPCLMAGCACIPLAGEKSVPREDGSAGALHPLPGAVRSVGYYGGLARPRLDAGDIQLPLANSGSDATETTPATPLAVGGMYGIAVNSAPAWEVQHGCALVPLASSASSMVGEDGSVVVSGAVPGVMDAVAVHPELEAPRLAAGTLLLPLANYDSAAGIFDRPGFIHSAVVDPAATSPTIRRGVLSIPANANPLADTAQGISGIVSGVSAVFTEGWCIDKGEIQIPRAQHDPEGGAPSVPGVLCGVEWETDAGRSAPSIWQGVLRIPVPDVSDQVLTHCKVEDTTESAGWVSGTTLHLHLAADSSAGLAPRAGLLAGVQTSTTATGPSLRDGILTLPASPALPNGLYDAVNNRKITWEQFLAGNSAVPLSAPVDGMRLCAFHLGGYLSFYLEKVAG